MHDSLTSSASVVINASIVIFSIINGRVWILEEDQFSATFTPLPSSYHSDTHRDLFQRKEIFCKQVHQHVKYVQQLIYFKEKKAPLILLLRHTMISYKRRRPLVNKFTNMWNMRNNWFSLWLKSSPHPTTHTQISYKGRKPFVNKFTNMWNMRNNWFSLRIKCQNVVRI